MANGDPPRTEAPTVPGYTTLPPPGAGGPPVAAAAPGQLGGRFVLSGWWRRVGAFLIDGLIVTVAAAALTIAIIAPLSLGDLSEDELTLLAYFVTVMIAIVCVTIVALLYAPAMMARTNGKTVGRMVTGIRVVRANGERITFGFAMLREVAVKTLLFGIAASITFGISALADALWPLWDEENRALHDFLVDTRTVID
jgi:uncharacterized RDD family membrane protein YckC